MSELNEELKKFIDKEIIVDLTGKQFAPIGILNEVHDDFIILGESRIIIKNISAFKETRKGFR